MVYIVRFSPLKASCKSVRHYTKHAIPALSIQSATWVLEVWISESTSSAGVTQALYVCKPAFLKHAWE